MQGTDGSRSLPGNNAPRKTGARDHAPPAIPRRRPPDEAFSSTCPGRTRLSARTSTGCRTLAASLPSRPIAFDHLVGVGLGVIRRHGRKTFLRRVEFLAHARRRSASAPSTRPGDNSLRRMAGVPSGRSSVCCGLVVMRTGVIARSSVHDPLTS